MQNDILTAENAVLGACLVNPGLWQEVFSELSQDDLATEAGRVVWNAARLLDAESAIPDAPAIAERIAGIPRNYLMELMEVACSPSSWYGNLPHKFGITNSETSWGKAGWQNTTQC